MPREIFKYTNEAVTVIWKPAMCIHSKICWTNLREVFDPTVKPWIQMEGSTTQKIIDQVRQCPSGALSYAMKEITTLESNVEPARTLNIHIAANGPILIKTECIIQHSDGREETKTGTTALCRCGASSNKPYCDGSHKIIEFKG